MDQQIVQAESKSQTGRRTANRGADLLARALYAQGVEQISGLTGGAIMEGMDALGSQSEMNLYFSQTEAGATWAAMGYARSTGKVGVCVVTSGPAATNTITPIADAHRDNVPLVVITGQVPTTARNTDAFQETNITEMVEPSAKKVFYLGNVGDIPRVVSESFRIAREGRPGPVLIDITKDAQQAFFDPERHVVELVKEVQSPAVKKEQIEDFVAALLEARRPVIIAGYGVVLAAAQRELAELLDIVPCPVVHTLPGKAALPSSHPCNFGMLGMHGFYAANWMVNQSDLIISLGSRYDDRITGDVERFAPAARHLVHFDIEWDQVNKVLPNRKMPVIGDLKETLGIVLKRVRDESFDLGSWHDEIQQILARYPSSYRRIPERLQAQFVIQTLNEVAQRYHRQNGGQVIYTTEVGDHQMWAGQYLHLEEGWQFLSSSGQGAMGAGVPMAMGAQMANPDALVVCIAGDGSLRMSEPELETIAEYNLPIKILVFNNHGYGIVRMWNHLFYEGRETGVVKRNKDWCLIARGSGFAAPRVCRITDTGELEQGLQEALFNDGPAFIELVTPYEECLPLMPPGKAFEDTVLDENVCDN